MEPIVERYQKRGRRLLFRADAAFARPEVYIILYFENNRFIIANEGCFER
jgi:hypothetical protein